MKWLPTSGCCVDMHEAACIHQPSQEWPAPLSELMGCALQVSAQTMNCMGATSTGSSECCMHFIACECLLHCAHRFFIPVGPQVLPWSKSVLDIKPLEAGMESCSAAWRLTPGKRHSGCCMIVAPLPECLSAPGGLLFVHCESMLSVCHVRHQLLLKLPRIMMGPRLTESWHQASCMQISAAPSDLTVKQAVSSSSTRQMVTSILGSGFLGRVHSGILHDHDYPLRLWLPCGWVVAASRM